MGAEDKLTQPDAWEGPQKVLVILAHPDDPEFFCGATLARWAANGHTIHYCLLTCGDKGAPNGEIHPAELCSERVVEQRAAADVIGVQQVRFLGYPDGYLTADLDVRRDVVRVIREEKPDVLMTCDPSMLYFPGNRLNHPDHRAAGQVVLDAVFPAAGNRLFFPELLAEGLEPHTPREVWVSLAKEPSIVLDVTEYWEQKIQALYEHKSQIGEPEEFGKRMRARHADGSSSAAPKYEERFHRILLK